jgi:hypothetical protein
LEQEDRAGLERSILDILRRVDPAQQSQRLDVLLKLAGAGAAGYALVQEFALADAPVPVSEARSDAQFMDATIDRPVPKHCRRIYYRDSRGVLRSQVICESLGGVRTYLDR